jgi:signal transduction histidine kinase/ligand-binding sensor domain-containing protein
MSKVLNLRLFSLLILYAVLATMGFAQGNYIRFEHISSEQGLSQSVVFCILQDSRGFMWFGTQNGLNRFNGYKFKEFKHNPKESSSLPVNKVHLIYEDSSETLWIGTEGGGLIRFNREKENFTRIRYNNDLDPNPGRDINDIMTIHEDRNRVLWIGTFGGGLLRFDPKKGEWFRFFHKPGNPGTLSLNRIRAFCEDRTGIMWIGTDGGGLNAFDPKTRTFTHFLHQPNVPDTLSHNLVNTIIEDTKGNLWVGTLGGLDKFDRKVKKFTHYRYDSERTESLSYNSVKIIFEDSRGILWIGTEGGGLNRLKSLSEGTFIHYLNHHNDPYSLSHNTVFSIVEDRTGCIWIGTYGGGINRIDPQKQQFVHFFSDPNKPNSLSSNDVSSFYEDKEGNLWIGTFDNGLNRYDHETGKFKSYNYTSIDPGGSSSNDVCCLYEDREGVLWIGTWGAGINCFDRDTGKFSQYKHNPRTQKGPGSNHIFCFCKDQYNHLWIGTWRGGLNLFVREKNEFIYYKNDPRNQKSLSSNSVTAIYPDIESEKFLWIGTYNSGLELFDRYTGAFKHYSHDPENLNSLSHNSVQSIYISRYSPEVVWVGTHDGGLNKFDRKTEKWHSYTEEDGLPNNTIYGILEDSNKNLWLSTSKGLSRFNPETMKFVNYDESDGLQSNEFNQGAFYKSRDGRFYFGGINGFNTFFPEQITENPHIPPVVLTDFKIFNKDVQLGKSISEMKEIRLSYKDYVFSFEFAALNYTATAKNRYAYKMEGLDNDWIQLDHKRDITFTRLPPGEYIFRVKGSNNDNVWNEEGTSIKIIITPPFWKTWWFRVLLILILLGIILGLYKVRVRQYEAQRKKLEREVEIRTREIREQKEIIEEKNNQLEISNQELKKSEMNLIELNATKDKFFSIISHDLKNPLTALLGTADLLSSAYDQLSEEKKRKYILSIDRSASHLYDLLDNLLQWSKSQTGGIQCKPAAIDLSVIIPETLSLYKINAKKKKINLSSNVEENTFAYADRNMVTTVLRNLISNAIKFTDQGGEVRITANADGKNEFVEISVIDSGIGISRENAKKLFKIGTHYSTDGTAKEKGTGLGLILCKEFIEINKGRIWFENPIPNADDNSSGKGSIFKFTLPRPPEM